MVIVHVYVSHNQMVIQGSSCRPRHFLGHSSKWLPDLGPFQHLGRHPGHVLHHHLLPQLLLAETWWNTCETHGETAGALQNALESAGTGVCFWEDEMTWRIRMTTVCWLKQLLVLLTCPCLSTTFVSTWTRGINPSTFVDVFWYPEKCRIQLAVFWYPSEGIRDIQNVHSACLSGSSIVC